MLQTLRTLPPFKEVVGLLLLLLVGGGLLLATLLHSSSHAFAASLQHVMGTTCVQAPSVAHCDQQDPELQGCAADALTLAQQDIMDTTGMVVGRVERRFSHACHAWWGRVFDLRSGPAQGNEFIEIAGSETSSLPTFVSPQYSILYSPMVFDASITQTAPEITGSLVVDAVTANLSATLPAITIPKQ